MNKIEKVDKLLAIERSNSMGCKNSRQILRFEEKYRLLVKYREEHGNCRVPNKYVTPEGVHLGRIIENIRLGHRKVSESEREKLDLIGFEWHTDKRVPFNRLFQLLVKYVEEFGNCKVPNNYTTPEGVCLGKVVESIRFGHRKLGDYERKKLDSIGFVWHFGNRLSFDEVYKLLVRYVKEYGNCKVPQKYITPEGIRLGAIVASLRSGRRKTNDLEREMLDSIGFLWNAKTRYT